MKKFHFMLLCLVALFSVIGAWIGLHSVFHEQHFFTRWFILMISFLLLSQWSVRLPSGASWRPAIMIITESMLLLPPSLTPLVALPGMLLISMKSKNEWWNYFLSIGHITIGLYAGGWVYQWLVPNFEMELSTFPFACCSLFVHLLVNRGVAAGIVSYKQNRSFYQQIRLTIGELNWGYFNTYMLSILSALLVLKCGLWASFLPLMLLWGIYKSVFYYSKMHMWQQAALLDGLTGAENRSAFDAFMKKQASSPSTGTLIMIDLDDFKLLNDHYGHEMGDYILREMVKELQQRLQKNDCIFRYGGDEFVLFISHPEVKREWAVGKIHQIFNQISESWKNQGLPVRASIGVASYPIDTDQFEKLLPICDEAMYREKAKRKQKKLNS